MKELFEYDNALVKYYKGLSSYLTPLSCWEFYGEALLDIEKFKDDFIELKKLTKDWNFSINCMEEFLGKERVIVVTNPNLKIVYSSHNIEKMNGYTSAEILGKSPKMFQGEETCRNTSLSIREAVQNQVPFEVSILNYRKDSSTYYCNIEGFPVFDKRGVLVNYIAFEKAA